MWQRTLLLFIQVRFETGVQLTAQEVEAYFTKTVKPAAEKAHPDKQCCWTIIANRSSKTHRRTRRPTDGYLAARSAPADECHGA